MLVKNNYWKSEFYRTVKQQTKCVGLINNKECPNNKIKMNRIANEFNHLNRKQKSYNISYMVSSRKFSIDEMFDEMLKCNILCPAHHMIDNHTENDSRKNRQERTVHRMVEELELNNISSSLNNSLTFKLHTANLYVINKLKHEFKSKPLPDKLVEVGKSNGIEITPKMYEQWLSLWKSNGGQLSTYQIANMYAVGRNTVYRYLTIGYPKETTRKFVFSAKRK
tara:strand:+ start:123 stop:791 length:669 start_codon:yes stop_codon:yes gene_type:complete